MPRSLLHRFQRIAVACSAIALAASALPSAQSTPPAPTHVNPVVAKLAAGQRVFGVKVEDLSMAKARDMARADVDFIRLEMEHAPMDFTALRDFLIGMIDKAAAIRQGNAQVKVATVARFLPYGREGSQWVAKQALDLGLMGIAFNSVDNKEQALAAVRGMRYPQRRGSKYPEPGGMRGSGATWANWIWGVNDYTSRADLWPLNPQGDLLAIMMIETVEGLKNVDEIASVPGVGVLWTGAFSDLSNSMGVPSNSPEVEAASQTILKACLAHNVVCGLNPANEADMMRRMKEGWRWFDFSEEATVPSKTEAMIRSGRAAK